MLYLHLISFFQIGATRNRNLHATTVFASTRNFNVTETQIVEMPQMRSLVGLHVSANFCVTQHQLVSCACFILTGNSAACGLFPVILKQAHNRSANILSNKWRTDTCKTNVPSPLKWQSCPGNVRMKPSGNASTNPDALTFGADATDIKTAGTYRTRTTNCAETVSWVNFVIFGNC